MSQEARESTAQEDPGAATQPQQPLPAPADVLYDDKFVTVDHRGVHIKWYYFPTANRKFVPFENITQVEAPTGCTGVMRYAKNWGMGLTRAKVWFACDMKMGRTVENAIILHTGSHWRKGFSVVNRAEALRVIQEECDRRRGLKPE